MDLRRWGSEYEKKFVELTTDDIEKIALNYHNWQQTDFKTTYKNIPEYCYSAGFDEIKEKEYAV